MRTKRKLVAGLTSLSLFDIAAAHAADLPLKAPKMAPAPMLAVYNWTGPYVGAHAGYRWADANFSSPAYDFGPFALPARNDNFRLGSGIVGAHVGYNYMISPTVLAGIEGDWTWGSASDSVSGSSVIFEGFALYSSEVRLTWQATIRGRLGWVNGPWLFYGTGGVAFAHIKWSDTVTGVGGLTDTDSWSYSKTKTGWTLGGGIEHMFNPNWLVRIEYLYESFGSFDVPHGFAPPPLVGKLDLDEVHKLRVGISYKFGGPVAAR
jgi:outer membrane immunogenic protein